MEDDSRRREEKKNSPSMTVAEKFFTAGHREKVLTKRPDRKGPEHLSLKVPSIEFDFDVSFDSVQWQTVTSNLRPYNSVQMSI